MANTWTVALWDSKPRIQLDYGQLLTHRNCEVTHVALNHYVFFVICYADYKIWVKIYSQQNLENQIHRYIKQEFQKCKVGTTFKNPSVVFHIGRKKGGKVIIISIPAGKKHLTKFNTSMVNTLTKPGKEENFLNQIKSNHKKPTANILMNSVRLNAFPKDGKQDKNAWAHLFCSALYRSSHTVQ